MVDGGGEREESSPARAFKFLSGAFTCSQGGVNGSERIECRLVVRGTSARITWKITLLLSGRKRGDPEQEVNDLEEREQVLYPKYLGQLPAYSSHQRSQY